MHNYGKVCLPNHDLLNYWLEHYTIDFLGLYRIWNLQLPDQLAGDASKQSHIT
jgi:hypothetical protein